MTKLHLFSAVAGATLGGLLLGAGALHLIPKLGPSGRKLSAALCAAPLLDGVVCYFTVLPLVLGPIFAGWIGLLAAIVAQVETVLLWTWLHELAHRDAVRGPRIVKVINQRFGRFRNHAAIWTTALVTPLFFLVRLAEVIVYPPLTWLVGLPRYESGDWVNVSRHKFQGLVGHDLIWCLYCDWMTGIWSLGTEMLRNVESFWCPIRFASGKKCQNCSVDFPDVFNGWIPADGTMKEVAELVDAMQSGNNHAWFGKRVELTVNGQKLEPEPAAVG